MEADQHDDSKRRTFAALDHMSLGDLRIAISDKGATSTGSKACLLALFGRQRALPSTEPNCTGPEVITTPSPAPPVVVEALCIGVDRMNQRSLDRFTLDVWKRFDHRDLEPLKWAIIRRRRVLAMQLRP